MPAPPAGRIGGAGPCRIRKVRGNKIAVRFSGRFGAARSRAAAASFAFFSVGSFEGRTRPEPDSFRP